MGRVLGPADYGTLGVLLSIGYIMGIFLNTLQTSIAKYVAQFKAKKEIEKVSFLLARSIRRFLYTGLLLSSLFILLIPFLATFLHIVWYLLAILVVLIMGTLLLPTVRGTLQGMQLFRKLGINLSIEGLTKFFGGVLFVALGWGVAGATLAFSLSFLVPFLLGWISIRKVLPQKKESFSTKEMYTYSIPVLCMLLCLTAFFSVDVILVKHFFSETLAGHYAALSILGKILFFGSISISQVLVPKVAELYEEGKAHKGLLYKSIGIIGALLIPAIIIYSYFPGFIINILFGQEYLDVAPLLGRFALFMTFFCITYLLAFYNIAVQKTRFIILLATFNILEIILLWIYHTSLTQVVNILVALSAILLVIMILYTKGAKK